MAEKKMILFHINKQVYGIDVDKVNAIEPITGTVQVPNAPENIEGIINLRGMVIPVFSLHRKFKLTREESEVEPKLIITRSRDNVFAFTADAVDEIFIVDSKDLSTPPKILQNGNTLYIDEIANIKGKLVLCLNVDRILSEDEKDNIKDFVDGLKE